MFILLNIKLCQYFVYILFYNSGFYLLYYFILGFYSGYIL